APAHPHPAATDDVNEAIDYMKANSSRLGADSTRIVLIGRSAGGQLALLSAYTRNDPAIKGVVAFYAPSDQVFGYQNPSNPRVINSREILEQFLKGNPSTAAESYASSSPVNYVGSHTIPTLLIHGKRDELVFAKQSERLDQQLARVGQRHLYIEMPWATHGCDYNFNGPCGQLSTYAIERFLASVLN
ncbi:MAG TPA: alpha/beta hydrolase, partial [Gemmatimonadaceae bacterium]|nr:alpha/beta hydrolase [Gemmatimonadaceae bacterium]